MVNIFDVTLGAAAAAPAASADTPEGNGTGFVWDSDGNVVSAFLATATHLEALL